MAPSSSQEPSGSWDSIHVFESSERGRQAHYKLTSTIMLQLTTHQASEEGGESDKKATGPSAAPGNGKYRDIQPKRKGEVTLSGSMTRQVCNFFSFDSQLELNGCDVRGHTFFLILPHCFWLIISQLEQDWPIHEPLSHVTNTGHMIEDMEIKMRNSLQEVSGTIKEPVRRYVWLVSMTRYILGRLEILYMIWEVWKTSKELDDRRSFRRSLLDLSGGDGGIDSRATVFR